MALMMILRDGAFGMLLEISIPVIMWAGCLLGTLMKLIVKMRSKVALIESMGRIWKFQGFLFDFGFIYMKFHGSNFTWSNNQLGEQHIKVRLDIAVCNAKFQEIFRNVQVLHLDPIGSDHCPILINLLFDEKRTPRCFKFEKRWVDHPDFKDIVTEGWYRMENEDLEVDGLSSMIRFCDRINRCRSVLWDWSKKAYPRS